MSTHWKQNRERSLGWVLKLALWGALNLGRRFLRMVLYPICLYFMFFAPISKKHAKKYLEKVLGKPVTWRTHFKHFHTFASIILDRVYFLKDQHERFEIEVHGLEHLQAIPAGQGAILLGAHLGSFEALRSLALKNEIPLKILMHMETSQVMTSMLHALNPKIAEAVITMGEPSSILQAKDWLDTGGYIGILADRVYQEDKTITKSFLGQDADFSTGPFRLTELFKVPVIFFCGVYLGANRYAIHFETLEFSDDSSVDENLTLFIQTLEHYVNKYPLNWFNFYDYWKIS